MGKTLVAYFSAEFGSTRKVAEALAEVCGADLYEIVPEKPYTKADLKYMNPVARCNREKIGKKDVPVSGSVDGFEEYDTVLLGFPIWYGIAPNVVHTFADQYDWTGKKVAVFATSGGSALNRTTEKLIPHLKGITTVAGENLFRGVNREEMKQWIESL